MINIFIHAIYMPKNLLKFEIKSSCSNSKTTN